MAWRFGASEVCELGEGCSMGGGGSRMTSVLRGPKANRVGEGLAFEIEDSFLERLRGIVGEDGANALEEDGSVVVLVIDDMDGAAGDLDTVIDGGLMDAEAVEAGSTEGRDEGGVDIDDAAAKVGWNEDMFEEPTHDDQFDLGESAGFEDGVGEVLSGSVLRAREDLGGNVGLMRESEAAGIGAAADDESKVDWEISGRLSIDKIFERRPTAGD